MLGALSALEPGVNAVPVGDDAQAVEQEFAADASGLVDDRQAAARMGAAADEVEVVDLVKLVLWSAPQHLVEAVSEVEDSATVAVVAPVFGRDDHLGDDVVAQAFEAEFGLNLLKQTTSIMKNI